MRPSFIFTILLATAAAADLVNVLRRADAPGEPIIEKFAWPRASEVTGVDTSQYLRSPAKASGGTFSCTTVSLLPLSPSPPSSFPKSPRQISFYQFILLTCKEKRNLARTVLDAATR